LAGEAQSIPVIIYSYFNVYLQLDTPERQAKSVGDHESLPCDGTVVVSIDGMTLREAVEETKRTVVLRAVEANDGNWAAAARSLAMARSNLHHMAERLGLRK
jgi:transcriptional regulator with GAF, ATPase, and Fis domain